MYVLGLILTIGAVTFSTAVPTLSRDRCKNPPRLDHAELMEDRKKEIYSNGHLAIYACHPGYMRLGSIKWICSDGTWIKIGNGQCKKRRCGNPGDIEFGTFELKDEVDFVFGATVEYTCDPGYQMISKHKTIECTATGWSKGLPHCEARLCPPVVDDSIRVISTVFDDEYTAGHVIRLECKNPNDNLNGPSQIYCTTNGTWNIDPPTCKGICRVNHDIMKQHNIQLKDHQKHQVAHDEVIEFQCIPRYETSDAKSLTTNCNKGVVTYPTCHLRGTCTVQNDTMKEHNIQLKKKQMRQVAHSEVIRFDCIAGYEILDRRNLTTKCNEGMVAYPTCHKREQKMKKKSCAAPPHVKNGEAMGEKKEMYDPGSIIQFKCSLYYKLKGKKSITCKNGAWDPAPTCIEPCILNDNYIKGNNTLLENAGEKYLEHNQSVQFKCQPTFNIPNPNLLNKKCLNGNLKYPKCVKSEVEETTAQPSVLSPQ